MKIIFKEGTKEMYYQCFITKNYNNYHDLKYLMEDHLETIVDSFLFNENEFNVPCYQFNGFIHKYKRNTRISDTIIFYFYPGYDIMFLDDTLCLRSYLNWELSPWKESIYDIEYKYKKY